VSYAVVKLLHVVAVILWIGPPIGAYLALLRAYRSRDMARIRIVEQDVERVLRLEHAAFLVLLASGVGLVLVTDGAALQWPWLQKKLWAVAGICAFEVFDIYVEHVVARRVFALADPTTSPHWGAFLKLRMALGIAAIPVALGMVPAALWFAVAKL
jgi:uncharacterized membrane protein